MTELLIIKPSSLGDIVQALRVATSLKAQRPGLRISWIVREIFAPIVRACEAVDHVYVFDRDGGAKSFLKLMREVRASLDERLERGTRESTLRVTIAQAIPKGQKMDYVVEKATELGIARLIPVRSARTIDCRRLTESARSLLISR